jgi:ABC-type uncharacterized transport system substrate-binding protein
MRRAFVCAFTVAVLISPISIAAAEETLVVLSSNAKPYLKAAQECEIVLNESGIDTKRVMLPELSSNDIQRLTGSVVVIGGRASAKLSSELNENVRLYYCMTPSPTKLGLINRPNTAGVSTETQLQEQITFMNDVSSSFKRVGVLYRSRSKTSSDTLNAIRAAIPTSWELIAVDLDSANSDSTGIKELLGRKIDIVWTIPDPSVYNSATIKVLLLESLRKEIPVFGFSHALVRAGATFGIGIDPSEQGKFAAKLVVNQATDQHLAASPQLAVNEIVADRISFKLPKSIIRNADVVFKSD